MSKGLYWYTNIYNRNKILCVKHTPDGHYYVRGAVCTIDDKGRQHIQMSSTKWLRWRYWQVIEIVGQGYEAGVDEWKRNLFTYTLDHIRRKRR